MLTVFTMVSMTMDLIVSSLPTDGAIVILAQVGVSLVTKGVLGILSTGWSESEERSMMVLVLDSGFFG